MSPGGLEEVVVVVAPVSAAVGPAPVKPVAEPLAAATTDVATI